MRNKAIFLFILSLHTFLLAPLAPALAQSLKLPAGSDLIAPVIQHEPFAKPVASGKAMSVSATVTDNVAVKEVLLFYRTGGTEEYLSVNMEPKGNDIYTTVIPQQDVKEPAIEYYIQASDPAGNIALRGFSFSPLTMTVSATAPGGEKKDETVTEKAAPEEETQAALRTETSEEKPWYKKWWVWGIVAGVVVIAAVAGGGGGGGGSSSPAPTPGPTPGPTTGSATISGPIP